MIGLNILSDLHDETLKEQLPDQELSALVTAMDFSEEVDGSRAVTVKFLHSTGSRSALSRCIGGQQLFGVLTFGRFPGGLYDTGYCDSLFTRSNLNASLDIFL